ncbi:MULTISPECIES: hypothetical protein [Neisseria]|uniref:Uncharacterized protein n=1 Tax=Neisseria weixii TaxID=1853276 RepID=A0A3N4MU26_9NEIS|nr:MULTISPECIES: hypothetical protein [Neisseria]RPD83180.1 hypothetical protein EGK74_13220 [Neisseria weixii]RPD83410.1 hypothetical protein EGK75_13215 [Neisseria weixii]
MQVLNLTKDDIYSFLNSGKIKNILFLNSDKYDVLNEFGSPPNHNPQRKKNKEIMGYGALNIYLLNNRVVGFSINILNNYLDNAVFEKIDKNEVVKFIHNNQIVIDRMYCLDNADFFDIHDKKLGFFENTLFYISIGI